MREKKSEWLLAVKMSRLGPVVSPYGCRTYKRGLLLSKVGRTLDTKSAEGILERFLMGKPSQKERKGLRRHLGYGSSGQGLASRLERDDK